MGKKKNNSQEQMGAYTEAVKSGLYAKRSGLVGKYDNVRRYWEDEITRHFLYPNLKRLIDRKKSQMKRFRILDLGCGSADGYELLSGIRDREANLQDFEIELIASDIMGIYKGVDLNEDLLNQARGIYGNNPKMIFEQGDFTKGVKLAEDEKPYDLYFTSYGTCSHHNEDDTAVRMLADIARQTEGYSVIMCDWLGRYSYEWQTLWTNDLSENRNMDYVVSYIYPKEEREQRRDELQHLYLRLMSRQEAEDIVSRASREAGVEIKPLSYFDRSVFTGRHMDTADYNPHAQPIRYAVNCLHEPNLRADFNSLIINYVPKQGFEFINDYLENLQMCWNTLVEYVQTLLENYDEDNHQFRSNLPPIPASYPDVLRNMMGRMKQVVEGVGWLGIGLPRENVIEPQLGYALRYLVSNLQQGRGCGHGLIGIFEVNKE
ncbi:MAG: class I SAM-dependent methyltransferase [Spirochaetota bacterium]